MAEPWHTRHEDAQPSGRVYIVLRCLDCPAELRLLKTPAGEEKARHILAAHKPSGCCDERRTAAR